MFFFNCVNIKSTIAFEFYSQKSPAVDQFLIKEEGKVLKIKKIIGNIYFVREQMKE